jgi:hypothetical protein
MTTACAGPRHATRQDAEHAARAMVIRGTPRHHMRARECGDHWHIGPARRSTGGTR